MLRKANIEIISTVKKVGSREESDHLGNYLQTKNTSLSHYVLFRLLCVLTISEYLLLNSTPAINLVLLIELNQVV